MTLFDTLSDYAIVPVIAIDDVKDALPLADAPDDPAACRWPRSRFARPRPAT